MKVWIVIPQVGKKLIEFQTNSKIEQIKDTIILEFKLKHSDSEWTFFSDGIVLKGQELFSDIHDGDIVSVSIYTDSKMIGSHTQVIAEIINSNFGIDKLIFEENFWSSYSMMKKMSDILEENNSASAPIVHKILNQLSYPNIDHNEMVEKIMCILDFDTDEFLPFS